MSALLSPGVYAETRVSPAALRSSHSLAGFVGLAPRGPLDVPQRLNSWSDYESVFGGVVPEFELGIAVYGFFANGGRTCFVVRVADRETAPAPQIARWRMSNELGAAVMNCAARHPGRWGNTVQLRLSRDTRAMKLTTLSAAATGSANIAVESSVDLRPGTELTIVPADDPERIISAKVIAVPDAATCQLDQPISGAPVESQVIGPGFALTVTLDSYVERFARLSLDPLHERSIEKIVNGPGQQDQELARAAAGHSRLVSIALAGTAADRIRPLPFIEYPASIDTATATPATQQILNNLRFPADIPVTRVSNALLFDGVMSAAQMTRLQELSSNTDYRQLIANLRDASNSWQWTQGTGASATPGTDPALPIHFQHFTGYGPAGYFPIVNPGDGDYRGLASLEAVEEVSLLAVVDLGSAYSDVAGGDSALLSAQRQLLDHCAKTGTRFALLDAPPPGNEPVQAVEQAIDHTIKLRQSHGARNGAIYFPPLQVPAIPGVTGQRGGPASGFLAGVYAQVEHLEGVHRSPANLALQGVVDTVIGLTESDTAMLNNESINCIRAFTNQSVRVWGARTLAVDYQWRYISARRLLLAIRKEIENSLGWATFEPNNTELQRGVAETLRSYLNGLFQRGVLAGSSAEEAYFVAVEPIAWSGENTLIARLGFAPLWPAEYVQVTVSRSANGFNVAAGPETPV